MKNYKIMMLMALSLSIAVQASWHRPVAVSADEGRIDQEQIARANQRLLQAVTLRQVQDALAAGADVHARHDHGRTALMNAVGEGRENTVRMLLTAGADVHARDNDGWTALMDAAEAGYENIVRLLLAAGADVHARDNDGDMVLMWAVLEGHENVVRMLLGWNDQMDALLARDDISDEAKSRLVALELQAVQDALDWIQTARQDQANEIHDFAIAVRPEIMQMLQDYLSRKSEQTAFDVVKVATCAPAMVNMPSVLASQVYEYLTPVSNASSVRNVARSVELMRKSQDFSEPFADAAV